MRGGDDATMPSVLITGANRGIGLEFARQYADDGWQVHACCRAPESADALKAVAEAASGRVSVHALDVADCDRIDALAAARSGTAIDVLVNNAGLFGPKLSAEGDDRQQFGKIAYDIWTDVLRVNTFAPTKMAEAFVDHVERSALKTIASITSGLGSIAETEGGYYIYRTSKAALNMAMASLARDLQPRGIAVGVFCPGWVKTDMGGPGASVEPKDSIAGLRR